jgi:hypothetical protein
MIRNNAVDNLDIQFKVIDIPNGLGNILERLENASNRSSYKSLKFTKQWKIYDGNDVFHWMKENTLENSGIIRADHRYIQGYTSTICKIKV